MTILTGCGDSSGSIDSNARFSDSAALDNNYTVVHLDYYQSECLDGLGAYLCFRTRFADDMYYEPNGCLFPIEGFSFLWGTRDTLRLEKTGVIDRCNKYRLVEIIDKQVLPIGTEFPLAICHWCEEPLVKKLHDGRVHLFYLHRNSLIVSCLSETVCNQLPEVD